MPESNHVPLKRVKVEKNEEENVVVEEKEDDIVTISDKTEMAFAEL
jgi:hypothetical protein